MPGLWSEDSDRRLWERRSKPVAQLAAEFGKTSGAIRSRLKHLQDPSHKAYKRRVGGGVIASSVGGGGGSRSSGLSNTSSHNPFASYSHMGGGLAAVTNTASSTNAAAATGIYVSPFSQQPATPSAYSPPSSVRLVSPSEVSSSSQQQQRIDPSSLNEDQCQSASFILSGGNAFLTGAAGVGKSYLLKFIIQGLEDRYGPKSNGQVVVAAPTGIAATHVNGVTIHSWSGVRLGKGGAQKLVPRVLQNDAACQRWRKARVLVLDEVSMMDGVFFEALDAIGREVRGRHDLPFGGIQLVLSGDFFQLPPVSLTSCGFAFQAPAWTNASVRMVELRKVVRQSGDCTFINILNQVRVGQCPPQITQALDACHILRKPLPVDGIVPTKLYCTNRNVDDENNRKLAQLPGNNVTFRGDDAFKGNYTSDIQRSITQAMDKKVPSTLILKVGAQVIITRNMPDHGLVNGSRGIVQSFERDNSSSRDGSDECCPLVHFSNGVRLRVTKESFFQGGASGALVRTQLPLKLAWSLTVHKSQGMTLDRAELQLDDAFDYGQVYVALSRVTSLKGLWIRGGRITQAVVKAHPKVIEFYGQNGGIV